jgi:hypothetical protein
MVFKLGTLGHGGLHLFGLRFKQFVHMETAIHLYREAWKKNSNFVERHRNNRRGSYRRESGNC